MSLRCSLFDLDNAYQKFFKEKTRYPKFKSKFNKQNYRTNLIKSEYKGKEYNNIELDSKEETWLEVSSLLLEFALFEKPLKSQAPNTIVALTIKVANAIFLLTCLTIIVLFCDYLMTLLSKGEFL